MMKHIVVLEQCDANWITNAVFNGAHLTEMLHTPVEPSEIGLIVFGGGVDVDPKYYHEPIGNFTQRPNVSRDAFEFSVARWAERNNIPMVGICRGAQLLTAYNGGKLIQDVSGHGGDHPIYTSGGDKIITNSYHHQMMFPWLSTKEFKVLAQSDPMRSKKYLGGHNSDVFQEWNVKREGFVEPEVIWWPGTKALCIQGHPEWLPLNHEFVKYCNNLIDELIVPHVHSTGEVARS